MDDDEDRCISAHYLPNKKFNNGLDQLLELKFV